MASLTNPSLDSSENFKPKHQTTKYSHRLQHDGDSTGCAAAASELCARPRSPPPNIPQELLRLAPDVRRVVDAEDVALIIDDPLRPIALKRRTCVRSSPGSWTQYSTCNERNASLDDHDHGFVGGRYVLPIRPEFLKRLSPTVVSPASQLSSG